MRLHPSENPLSSSIISDSFFGSLVLRHAILVGAKTAQSATQWNESVSSRVSFGWLTGGPGQMWRGQLSPNLGLGRTLVLWKIWKIVRWPYPEGYPII